jgi:exodeoxyribonuclease V beta subunit
MRFARPESLPSPADRLVVVEASAGTGKTFFLEHRVADLVLSGAPLTEILLVTFTDKAVAELRLRIRDLLDRMVRASESTTATSAWELDDAARARLVTAIRSFDHAQIFTIHGFCHRVLVEDAFAARRLLEQRQVADEVAFDAAFGALLRERFAKESPDRELLALYLERDGTVDKLRELLLRCARSGGVPRRHFDLAHATSIAERLRTCFGTAELRAGVLRGVPLKGNDLRWMPDWLELVGCAVARLDARPESVMAACDELRGDRIPKLIERLERAPAYRDHIVVLRDALAATSLDEAIAGELLPHLIARIGADKAEHGMFDYDDMLRLVREALHGPRGRELATRLRARTPWVMIDEFQDTDVVQWDIFRTVWMDEAARGLTIVGDPKQAIYGFRGADVATYMHARDELVRAGATRVALDVNRRSTAPLVEALNELLAGGAPLATPLLSGEIAYDRPVRASGDITVEGAFAPVTVFALQGANRDANKGALVEAIGAEIERLRAAPPVWHVRGTARPFSLGQVLVLTRANKESAEVAAALRARGLPCALLEAEKLFETREASELAAVLAAVAAPRDRSARLRALRTRFFDVPWAELMRVVDAPDHHPAIARLFDWAALATRRAYEPLFRHLVEDSRFAERALVLGGGERAVVNTWHLIELLLEEVARSRCDLHELVTQLRGWIADGHVDHVDDRDVQRVETDAEAIRVMTVHKAKGLEAAYVFLYGGIASPPSSNVHTLRDDHGRALFVGNKTDARFARVEAEQEAEHERLAYVALTRAQVRLYLPRYGGDKDVRERSLYEPIQRCLVPLVARRHPLLDIRDIAVADAAALAAPADALAGFDPPAPVALVELAPITGARGGLAMLSYTRLAHQLGEARLASAEHPLAFDPAELDVDDSDATEVGADELPAGADAGLLLHDLLERADLAGVRAAPDWGAWAAQPEVRELLVECARTRGIAPEYLPHAARIVHGTLTAPLVLAGGDPLPPLVTAPALAREVEFTYPVPGALPRGLVRGFIDALVCWDGELWVLDYKSDRLGGADLARAAADRVDERYAVQQRLYALAADRMRGARPLAGLLFAFVRHGITVAVRTSETRLAEWTRWLAGLAMEAPP